MRMPIRAASPSITRPSRGRTVLLTRRLLVALGLAVLLLAPTKSVAHAVTVQHTWRAAIGPAGVYGAATLRTYTNRTASLVTSARNLRARTWYHEGIYRGSCAVAGTQILRMPVFRTTSSGTARTTNYMTVTQAGRIRTAIAQHIRLSVRISGHCGNLLSVSSRAIPSLSHIYVIVMENHEYGSIVGNASAPYINSLISRYGLATDYHAVSHPSEPNYLALFSGSTQGVTDDGVHSLAGRNLADQLAAKGKTWRVFAQNVPLGCYNGTTSSGGADGAGTYARKHEPAISFTNIRTSAVRCARITNFAHFDPAAANFEFIVPNMCNDMHDCSVATGDTWLKGFVPKILTFLSSHPAGVLILTWDEGSTSLGGGGKVATLVIGPRARAGYRSAIAHNHYSLLRTVENAWGLGCLNHTCQANDLREFFR
jgi:hypothetical protein